MNNNRASAIDLFSGCGGLSLGLKRAGFDVLAGVEIDFKAASTYRANHPDVELFEQDIAALEPAKLMADIGIAPGQLGLLAACPPCQGFSRIRTKNGARVNDDPRNNLAIHFLRFAVEMKPFHVLLENVPGLLNQSVWKKIVAGLESAGYVLVHKIVDASDYGVPQRRRRLILLGSRIGLPSIPSTFQSRVTVRDALAEIDNDFDDELHCLRPNHSAAVQRIISAVPKNGGSRSDIPVELRLACHARTNGFSDVYGRMSLDDVSPTITSGCINPSKGRFIHPIEDRSITLREAAVLQGFPIDYRFDVRFGKESLALMIGNALPPPMIEAHAKALFSIH